MVGRLTFLGVQGLIVNLVAIIVVGNLLKEDTIPSCVKHCYYKLDLMLSKEPSVYQVFSTTFPEEKIHHVAAVINDIIKIILGSSVVFLISHVLFIIGIYLQNTSLLIPWFVINALFSIILLQTTFILMFYFSGFYFHDTSLDGILVTMVLFTMYTTYYKLLSLHVSFFML